MKMPAMRGKGNRPRLEGLSAQGKELLAQGADLLGVPLTAEALELFSLYYREIIRFRRAANLTSLKDENELVIKHFLDSLSPLRFLPAEGPLGDIGSGAGFPGIPLKIAQPKMVVVLVEASEKKAAFLRHVVGMLRLGGITILGHDARELKLKPQWQGYFNALISRAVWSILDMAQMAQPLLAKGGIVVAMKGPRAREELDEFQRKAPFQFKLERVVPFALPFSHDHREIIVFSKY